jgi:signal transduction histidine kinase
MWASFLKDKGILLFPATILLVLVGTLWLIHSASEQQIDLARKMVIQEAIAHFDNMVIARRWNAGYGGVYVKQQEGMKPNRYLKNNHILSSDNEMLIKINPAWMTRQISELSNEKSDYYYHITSLKPINPGNAPDPFEIEALNFFERQRDEKYYHRFTETGQFNFMGALVTERPCLKCHRKQGYKVGDIRGGIRVSLPLELYREEVELIQHKRNLLMVLLPLIALLIIGLFIKYSFTLKQTRERMIMSEKMASLGGLVAGMAHEINTPVGIGIGSASQLTEMTKNLKSAYQQEEVSEEEFEKYLQDAVELGELTESNLKRAAELVRSFKQVAVDQSIEEQRAFQLKEYIDEVLLSLKNQLKRGRISVVVDCPADLVFTSYPGAFSQIITNLIINSITHGFEPGGEGKIRIEAGIEDDLLQFIYSDNGKGIAKQHLSKIFDPFFTTNRQGGSTGLGMQIIYNLVTEKLNGDISCESEPGEGVRFTILAPVSD